MNGNAERKSGAVFETAAMALSLHKLAEALGFTLPEGESDATCVMACAKRASELRSVLDVGLTTKARVLEVLSEHMLAGGYSGDCLQVAPAIDSKGKSYLRAQIVPLSGRCIRTDGASLANVLASLAEKVHP